MNEIIVIGSVLAGLSTAFDLIQSGKHVRAGAVISGKLAAAIVG